MGTKRHLIVSITTRAAVCAALLIAAGTVFALLRATRPEPARSTRTASRPSVIVMRARPVPVRRVWDAYGTAEAMASADVPARVSAIVSDIPETVLRGASIGAGDLLVALDESDFARQVEITTQAIADLDAQLERLDIEKESWAERRALAREQVELARAELQRAREAFERDGARQREVDQARAAVIRAVRDEVQAREAYDSLPLRQSGLAAQRAGQEAALRLARLNLERCSIRSPLTGVIQDVDVEVGENLAIGQRVARVVDLARIEVPLRLPASARPSVQVGDDVRLRPSGDGGRSWTAQVTRIAPEADQETRTMMVFVEVEQDPRPAATGLLVPGQFVRGQVVSSAAPERWIVPRRALDGDLVLLVNDGKVVRQSVEVAYQVEARFPEFGLPDEQWVVLREPLAEGAMIIANASRALADGLAVQPVFPAGAAETRHADRETPP